MKYLKKFEGDSYKDAVEYLKVCLIDMVDKYGVYNNDDDDYDDGDGVYIGVTSYNENVITVITPKTYTGTYSTKGEIFHNIEEYRNKISFIEKLINYLEEGIEKFKIKYKFDYILYNDDDYIYGNIKYYREIKKRDIVSLFYFIKYPI